MKDFGGWVGIKDTQCEVSRVYIYFNHQNQSCICLFTQGFFSNLLTCSGLLQKSYGETCIKEFCHIERDQFRTNTVWLTDFFEKINQDQRDTCLFSFFHVGCWLKTKRDDLTAAQQPLLLRHEWGCSSACCRTSPCRLSRRCTCAWEGPGCPPWSPASATRRSCLWPSWSWAAVPQSGCSGRSSQWCRTGWGRGAPGTWGPGSWHRRWPHLRSDTGWWHPHTAPSCRSSTGCPSHLFLFNDSDFFKKKNTHTHIYIYMTLWKHTSKSYWLLELK